MLLFQIHCGYNPKDPAIKMYECHANFFVAAKDAHQAKQMALALPAFKDHFMHIDSIVQIEKVMGFEVHLKASEENPSDRLVNYGFREVAKL